MSNIAWLIFSLAFFALFLFLIFRKFPQLAKIPEESIENRETFLEFLFRTIKNTFSIFSFKKIKIAVFTIAEKFVFRAKKTIAYLHKMLEILLKDIKEKARKEKWEESWFSKKEKDKHQSIKD